MADLIRAEYPCSQMDLYSVLDTAWGNYGVHLVKFSEFKALYTMLKKDAALTAIAAARAMPDDDARSGVSEMMHINLVKLGRKCLQQFQYLKSYIDTAYADDAERKVQYLMAGHNYYAAAANEDWESMALMNTSAENYLDAAANVAALEAGDNMPATFPPEVKVACDAFDVQYMDFKMAEQTSVPTADKVRANNVIYEEGMSMLKDGQKIFMYAPEVGTKFVFDNLLSLINPAEAGIKGSVKEAGSFLPMGSARVVVQQNGMPAVDVQVDAAGRFNMQLPVGAYVIRVSADGYVDQSMDVDLKLTGLRWLHVEMVKVV